MKLFFGIVFVAALLLCVSAKNKKLKLHQDSFAGHTFQLYKDKTHRNVTWDALFFKSQVQVLFTKEWQRIQECKSPSTTFEILDMGCGPGYFARELLKQNSHFQVTCMDIDPLFVDYTKQVNAKVLHPSDQRRMQVLQGSIFDTKLPSQSFDLITIRFVLQHLRYQYTGEDNPMVVALKEMKRLLKPGGKLFVEDSDSFYPDIINPVVKSLDKLETKYNRYEETLRNKHKDFDLTRKYHADSHGRVGSDLYTLLQRAQFEHIKVDSVFVHSDELQDKMKKFIPMIHPFNYYSLVELKIVSKKEYETVVADFEQIYQSDHKLEEDDPLKPFMAIFTQTACGDVSPQEEVEMSIGYEEDVIPFTIQKEEKLMKPTSSFTIVKDEL